MQVFLRHLLDPDEAAAVSKVSVFPCLRMPYKVPLGFWLSCRAGSYCHDHLLWRVLCTVPSSMPNCYFSSVSFPLPPVESYPRFLAETLQQSGMFILAVPRRVCTEPASCLPTWVFLNQVMTNWLIQNLSRTKWWGRRLWRAAIILQLSVVRPQITIAFVTRFRFHVFKLKSCTVSILKIMTFRLLLEFFAWSREGIYFISLLLCKCCSAQYFINTSVGKLIEKRVIFTTIFQNSKECIFRNK